MAAKPEASLPPMAVEEGPYEVVPVPDTLRRKALATDGTLDEGRRRAIGDAEAALERLSAEFDGWMAEEVDRLLRLYRAFRRSGSATERDALFKAAHDMKGHAASLGYPLAGRMAGSLAHLIADSAAPPPELVGAHVEAIRASVREKATAATDPVGSALASELERLTERVVGARET